MKELFMVILVTIVLSPFLPFIGMIIGFLMTILAAASPLLLGVFYGYNRIKNPITKSV